jgi:cytochrome c peroxidase
MLPEKIAPPPGGVLVVLVAAILVAGGTLPAQGGLPPVPVPAGNPVTPQKAILGKLLFWEEQMSSDNRVACGTCHPPQGGGGDLRRVVHPGADGIVPSPDDTFGSPGTIRSDANNDYLPSSLFGLRPQVTRRAAPSFLTAAWFPELFWDGRARGQFVDPQTGLVSLPAGGALESQAVGPIVDSGEMGHDQRTWAEATGKLATAHPMALAQNVPPDLAAAIAQHPSYPDLFAAAFGDPAITSERIAFAIATYERTLVPDQTPWDQFQRGVPGALTQQQWNGLAVFNGPGLCNLCHVPGLFSDRQFRNLGLRPVAQDSGRQAVTGSIADRGRFKVPSLRNVGLRRSFMHTGQFTDLTLVANFYNGGGGPNLDNKDPLLRPLGLSLQQRNALVDFLANGLTDPRVRNATFPFDRPTLLSERTPPLGVQYGPGSPGTGGRLPDVLAGVPANTGNVDFKVGVGNARGAAPATLAVALLRAPPGLQIQGVNVNVDFGAPVLFGVPLGGTAGLAGAGFGTVRFPVPDDPAFAGLTLFAQWFVWDAAVPLAASTRGAELRFF